MEDVDWGLYSDSLSQRGRTYHPGGTLFAQPMWHPPSSPPPPASLVIHALASPTLCQTSQRAEFCFNCSLDKPVLTAFVTVTVREEFSSSALAPVPSFAPTLPGPQPSPTKNEDSNLVAPIGIGHCKIGKDNMQVDIISKDSVPKKDNEDGEDEYLCRIVEEPPSPAHEQ